jgi:hypothetical protein
MRPARVALLGFVLLPLIAWASDMRVAYTVQDKPFRSAITGTNLTFQLYSDAVCTSALGAPAVVPVDNLELIERLKRGTPKGGTKGPTTDRLGTVLTGVAAATQVYLKVSGTGVTASGPDCQLQYLSTSTGANPLPCVTQVGTDVIFTGCNVNVRDGSGDTAGATNGLGNLIIGYNEGAGTRTGSHNLVVGPEHSWTSFGGIVAGKQNSISGPFASVTGGNGNTASGYASSVSGGVRNYASAYYSSVSGGRFNSASGYAASVSGGYQNQASGKSASVSGGESNYATNYSASVSGGGNNYAQARGASISGGRFNYATDTFTSVSGGTGNYATSRYASVSGGVRNKANAYFSSVAGGYKNTANARYASVSGGMNNNANAKYATVGGGTGVTNASAGTWHAGQDGGFPTGTEY